MPEKWKRCVSKVKSRQSKWCEDHGYPLARDPSGRKCAHPYKVCSRLRGTSPDGPRRSKKKIYTGPRGGMYYITNGRKVYVKP